MKTPQFVLLLILGLCASAVAAEGDFKKGTYTGQWGGIPCTYEVTSQDKGRAIFRGKILLDTQQYDTIKIEQLSDNSLAMHRYLSGAGRGQTQWVQTFPPDVRKSKLTFFGQARGGPGMQGLRASTSFLIMPR